MVLRHTDSISYDHPAALTDLDSILNGYKKSRKTTKIYIPIPQLIRTRANSFRNNLPNHRNYGSLSRKSIFQQDKQNLKRYIIINRWRNKSSLWIIQTYPDFKIFNRHLISTISPHNQITYRQ